MKIRLKHIMALLLAGTLFLSLAACGSSDSDADEDETAQEEDEDDEEDDETGDDEYDDEKYDESEDDEYYYEDTDEEDLSANTVISLDQTFLDTDALSVTAVSLQTDDEGEIILTVELVNKTEDENYVMESDAQFLDGYEYNGTLYEYLMAGVTEDVEIELSAIYEDPDIDLESVTEIGIELTALANAGETVGAAGNYYIYPAGEETAAVYVREGQSTDQVLVDNDYVTLTYTGCSYSYWGEGNSSYFYVYIFAENKTDSDLFFAMGNGLLNNSEEDMVMSLPYTSQWVCAGKCKYITIMAECSYELGYTDVSEFTQAGFDLSCLYFLEDRSDTGDKLFTETFDIAL